MAEGALELVIVTPAGRRDSLICDSVRLTMPDDVNGRGGGSVGIRAGHAPALIALAPGPVTAWQQGACVLRAHSGGGFAAVKDGAVTLLLDTLELEAGSAAEI